MQKVFLHIVLPYLAAKYFEMGVSNKIGMPHLFHNMLILETEVIE
jgi:hypothetical protein